ncbi:MULTISPECIES: ZIP family metal transporter [Nitrosomonas]|uniref:Zinc and cadmium transporter n=2 Tax=Nitrosomonas eutropha TaxID=916 RepID=A0ABX5M6L8_9PROT|nr:MULTISPECIES: ZIP family metal transporter [Nitrosomonas]ABI58740.1 zinc/iron permease [Nitrosomonas eutropha C91]MXS79634.1 ZIP family metal transporter [Nitrosomonas sp. GH22]PXV80690.1 zinc and cadmium transporter [Nitrosomonas eutropha]SCX02637.1 zinc and cadmium transporter [Nitrosomonas eutropha]SDW22781.1 zinc and cadmium transporter [Nitrosomonas eutropha]
MSVLAWIVLASVASGLLSIGLAALFALNVRSDKWINILISYAIGALLGAAFLNALPEALELTDTPKQLTFILLLGILVFFILEKLLLWRHCHLSECEAHEPTSQVVSTAGRGVVGVHDHGRSGMMIILGDTFHNFVDGILIATAFMADIQLGMVTAIAITAHEIPQEAGDFIILLNSGFTRAGALWSNLLSSTATVFGGLLGYFMLNQLDHLIAPILAIAAASMIYVAMSDLIPSLHKRPEIGATVQQVTLIVLGISTIWLIGLFFGHNH